MTTTRTLACGCDVSGRYPLPARCAFAQRLRHYRDACARAAEDRQDAHRARFWQASHRATVALAAHLLQPENR